MARLLPRSLTWFSALTLALSGAAAAAPNDVPNGAVEKGIGLQPPVTDIMRRIEDFHNGILLWTCIVIVVFVLALLLWIMVRYNAKRNPVPGTFSHNSLLEVLWTGIPVVILVVIAIPSFNLLAYEEIIPKHVDVTIKATGSQWYWDYEYPDNGDFTFTSKMLDKAQAAAAGKPYRLGVNEPIYLPVNKIVKVIITGADVIHSWTVPAFGVKKDAVPGRLNEVWFKAEKEGVYFGQCSELCGADHAFMPIEVHIVSDAAFATWVTQKQKESGLLPAPGSSVAANR